MLTVILLSIVLGLVTIFTIQNSLPVTITFLFWKFEASLAVVIFLTVLSGMISGALLMVLLKIRSSGRHVKKSI